MHPRFKRISTGLCFLLIAGCIWVPCLHFFFSQAAANFYRPAGVSPRARELAVHQLKSWTDPTLRQREILKMRASNAEWDFMGRSFLVWSLANMGLRDHALKPACLQTMDQIISQTLQLEREKGMYFFLMSYARARPYVTQPAHSLFLDGEIALMLASRRLLEEKSEYKSLLTARVDAIVERFKQSPHLALESYPDECWMFDHVVALDPEFARDQYNRAREDLGEITAGFGYAHEWPASWNGPADIDSGPVIPVFNISAGSSGMAFIGAAAFQDEKFLSSLAATLEFAAFPSRKAGGLKYSASNQVGDAALLYAATLGPIWERVQTKPRNVK